MRRTYYLFFPFVLFLLQCSADSGEPLFQAAAELDCTLRVATTEGEVTGTESRKGGTCAYLGIPFAEPPVDTLRFAPPEPPAPRNGVFRAVQYGSTCLQKSDVSSVAGSVQSLPLLGDEDCLYLNIWRPPGENLPVMVFIYGGAFVVGGGSWGLYEGDILAGEDVIVVTLNYRLGPLGFFAHPALQEESTDGSTGNQGLQDQIRGLEWIRDNIENFGGDPDNVTIFGESAGAMSVCSLMASPRASGLFHRAIMQSGACTAVADLPTGFERAAGYAADTACEDEGDAQQQLACMRRIPGDELLMQMEFDIIASGLQPHVDGVVLEEVPLETIRANRHNNVPLISGANADEVRPVSLTNPHSFGLMHTDWSDYYRALEYVYGVTEAAALWEFYNADHFSNPFESWFALKSEFMLGCPAFLAARDAGAHGAAYHYLFDWNRMESIAPVLGAAHAVELFFIFGSYEALRFVIPDHELDGALALSRSMRALWANFARDGYPHADGVPTWDTVDAGSLRLDRRITPVSDRRDAVCEFWDPRLPLGMENITADLLGILEGLP